MKSLNQSLFAILRVEKALIILKNSRRSVCSRLSGPSGRKRSQIRSL